jgi:DNA modification methylase
MSVKVIDQVVTEKFSAYHSDCVDVVRGLPDSSVDFSVFSPPFASLYTYSASDRDMGNVKDHDEFHAHFSFLIRELARVLRPGRLVAVHCMQIPMSKAKDGAIGVHDFRGEIIRAFRGAGFIYHSEVCIWKDPVMQMQRTKALGLLHKTIRTDSSMSRQGMADYLCVFRKDGKNDRPVSHTHESFPVERWQRYASPVWATSAGVDDEGFVKYANPTAANLDKRGIDQGDTLQYTSAREHNDEKHICPLQLEVIRRAVRLWTNPGDVVLSPFMGIGSEGFVSLQEGRRFVGAELKASYYGQAVRNLQRAADGEKQASLFGVAAE